MTYFSKPSRSKKKLLFLITELNVGGAEKYLLKLLPNLQNGYQVKLISLQRGILLPEFQQAKIKVDVLDLDGMLALPKSIYRFYRIVREFKPDALVTCLVHADLFGRVGGRLFGVKKIISNVQNKYLKKRFLYRLERYTAFLVDQFWPNSHAVAQFLVKEWHIPKEKIVVMPNFVDEKTFAFNDDGEGTRLEQLLSNWKKRGYRLVVSLSSLSKHKRVEDLIKAAQLLFESKPNVRLKLIIFNIGSQEKNLKRQVTELGLSERIKFLGLVTNVEIVYEYADVVVLTSAHEGMSTILLEAMYWEKPIIATDLEENQEALAGYPKAFWYPVADVAKLSQLLQRETWEKETKIVFPQQYTLKHTLDKFHELFSIDKHS